MTIGARQIILSFAIWKGFVVEINVWALHMPKSVWCVCVCVCCCLRRYLPTQLAPAQSHLVSTMRNNNGARTAAVEVTH